MDFTFDTEQQMLCDSVARFLQNEYDFDARMKLVAAAGGGSAAIWQKFAENGWIAASCPEEFGGFGGSVIDTAIICEQFGRGLVIEPWLGSAVLGLQTLLASDDAEAKTALLPRLCDGSQRIAVAWSETAARGVPNVVATTSKGEGDILRLHGTKTLVLGGVGADAYLVSVRLAGSIDARDGIALCIVEAGAPGLSISPTLLHDGSLAATITLDGANARLLQGDGLRALEAGLGYATCALCAELVGAMERAIEITADYLRTRKQFGVTIGSFQSLQHRMADMVAELELARSMLFVALASQENDEAETRVATLAGAKALITGAARSICAQAIQLHGGIGMTEECAIGHYFKRAVVADALLGGRIVQERICTASLLGELAEAAE
ncbi:acyl-CoA dehydrogenase family protein [Novosphingobium aquae]|uniref:Acyl-CoA dehydrogenase family protein n=1 Tax=Novosphingobium aquae TaxID=3133435 RepID=A0ABU8S7A6_9SPHN